MWPQQKTGEVRGSGGQGCQGAQGQEGGGLSAVRSTQRIYGERAAGKELADPFPHSSMGRSQKQPSGAGKGRGVRGLPQALPKRPSQGPFLSPISSRYYSTRSGSPSLTGWTPWAPYGWGLRTRAGVSESTPQIQDPALPPAQSPSLSPEKNPEETGWTPWAPYGWGLRTRAGVSESTPQIQDPALPPAQSPSLSPEKNPEEPWRSSLQPSLRSQEEAQRRFSGGSVSSPWTHTSSGQHLSFFIGRALNLPSNPV